MHKNLLILYKEIGETPLECLNRFRASNPLYKDIKLSYVGRLDPMAHGLLVVVVGEENKKREEYLALSKEYEVDVLFGFRSDTADVLGMAERHPFDSARIQKNINDAVNELVTLSVLPYPAYSSKTVNGKPLWVSAREGTLKTEDIPKRKVKIYSAKIINVHEVSEADIRTYIFSSLTKVKGDFRQREIITTWRKLLSNSDTFYTVAKIHVACGSGVYMRTLASHVGMKCGTEALALGIKRLSIGKYRISDISK